jgi:hypothetical protein
LVGGVVDVAAEERIATAIGMAKSATGDITVEVSSRSEAEMAGERFVGEGGRNLFNRSATSGPAIGRISADETRVYRFPTVKLTGLHAGRAAANLERRIGGETVGNTHLIFPEDR